MPQTRIFWFFGVYINKGVGKRIEKVGSLRVGRGGNLKWGFCAVLRR